MAASLPEEALSSKRPLTTFLLVDWAPPGYVHALFAATEKDVRKILKELILEQSA